MALLDELNTQMKDAMKAKDKVKLGTIRMLKTALTNKQIELNHDLTPDEERAVLSTELKQRRDSLREAEENDRPDMVESLKAEIAVVENYLPAQLDQAQVTALVDEIIQETGASGKADFGKVMKALMPKVKGQADGAMVNAIVKEKLQ